MLCELGFLVDMLEKASGQNCQASNFLKTLRSLPAGKSHACVSPLLIAAASSLNLLEEHAANTPLTMMIQSVNRFLLDKFITDFRKIMPQSPYSGQVSTLSADLLLLISQAMATKVTTTIRCAHCNHEQMRPEEPLSHDLSYPLKVETKPWCW
jgi:PAB-dependent poly(A)-specific ribonuclease subunit 2